MLNKEQKEQIIKLREDGLSFGKIADIMCCNVGSVSYLLNKVYPNVDFARARALVISKYDEAYKKAFELRLEGKSYREIYALFPEVPTASLMKYLNKWCLIYNQPMRISKRVKNQIDYLNEKGVCLEKVFSNAITRKYSKMINRDRINERKGK